MSTTKLEVALDDCLRRMRAGELAEHCLADYSEQADVLRPLLLIGRTLQTLPQRETAPTLAAAGQAKMLAALATKQQRQNSAVSVSRWRRYTSRLSVFFQTQEMAPMKLVTRATLAFLVLFLVGGWFSVAAAANDLPGDPLYPVKLTWESVHYTFTFDPAARNALARQHFINRQQEIEALQNLHRAEAVRFADYLVTFNDYQWQVGAHIIAIDETTHINGTPSVGAAVHVEAQLHSDGTLSALQLDVTANHPLPLPTHTPHPPTHTPEATHTPEPPTHTPESTHTHVPTHTSHPPTHTPEPTYTPEPPTHTPESTHTPHPPTHTPEPTHEPTHTSHPPTHTPEPTPTHEPTQTPHPSSPTHEPTHTPVPTHLATPSHTPHPPTHTVVPTQTALPTHTPFPTHTPEPTHNPTHTPHPTATPTHHNHEST